VLDSRHLKANARIIALFGVGFVLGEVLGFMEFRDVVGEMTPRYFLIAAIETTVAAGTFATLIAYLAKRRALSAPRFSAVIAFLFGLIGNAVTVGTYSQVPPIAHGEAQLIVYIAAIALASGFLGYLQASIFRNASPSDS
jgi:hypothetical protein